MLLLTTVGIGFSVIRGRLARSSLVPSLSQDIVHPDGSPAASPNGRLASQNVNKPRHKKRLTRKGISVLLLACNNRDDFRPCAADAGLEVGVGELSVGDALAVSACQLGAEILEEILELRRGDVERSVLRG